MITFNRRLSSSTLSNLNSKSVNLKDIKSTGIGSKGINFEDVDFDNDAQRRQQYRREQSLLIIEPALYEGCSFRGHIEFIRACELVFETRLETYKRDKDRVLFRTSHLRGEVQDKWYEYKNEKEKEEKTKKEAKKGENSTRPSWDDFRDFMREYVPVVPVDQPRCNTSWLLTMPLERNSLCECYHRYSGDE